MSRVSKAISQALFYLTRTNHKLYDYWMNELYDVDGSRIVENWTEENLRQMEDDVMNNTL